MKVYVTKYALTKGILEFEVVTSNFSDMVKIKGTTQLFHKNEWWNNKADAIKHAEEMRLAKIHSLQKQIIKLQNLKF